MFDYGRPNTPHCYSSKVVIEKERHSRWRDTSRSGFDVDVGGSVSQ